MSTNIQVDIQWAAEGELLFDLIEVDSWVRAAFDSGIPDSILYDQLIQTELLNVTLRVVEEAESAGLNRDYREKKGSTNVLAFPADAEFPGLDMPPERELGDLVVCLPVVRREAAAQDKQLVAHFAHMIIHGVLHLLGFDHINDSEAEAMEALEVIALSSLGYSNPYEFTEE
ncbi:MAG: rRNA maturation RNase YbeY [Gammaproteobacteria bacterium]|nr:rRNA maturation RNase YbeY [Gammaproteobacteria bacterium]